MSEKQKEHDRRRADALLCIAHLEKQLAHMKELTVDFGGPQISGWMAVHLNQAVGNARWWLDQFPKFPEPEPSLVVVEAKKQGGLLQKIVDKLV